MISHITQSIRAIVTFIDEIKNLSISQWDMEQEEDCLNDDYTRQQR